MTHGKRKDPKMPPPTPRLSALRLAFCLATLAGATQAQDYGSGHFSQTSGEALYKGICQGCHMPAAQGAVGAGAYPALARNENLAGPAYPALMVISGLGRMAEGFITQATGI